MFYTISAKGIRSNIIVAEMGKSNVSKSQIKSSQQDASSSQVKSSQSLRKIFRSQIKSSQV